MNQLQTIDKSFETIYHTDRILSNVKRLAGQKFCTV